MATTPFKALVVGCGPAGLAAAHALSLAGINYTILERNTEMYKDNGATFVLWPHGLRLLAQMGLWPRLQALEGAPIYKNSNHTWGGKTYHSNDRNPMKQLFGSETVIFSRCQVLRQMYDALSESDKARILTGKQVVDVENTDAGVTVKCEDGTVHEGSILIGADGIYSNIRRFVREIPLSEPVEKELPYEAEFRCIWFSIPQDGSVEAGTVRSINGKHANAHILAGRHEIWALVYEVMNPVVKSRVRYTDQDMEAFVERWGHMVVADKLTVRDCWKKKTVGGMTNLDEGILQTSWHRKRMVLVGDAKHKMTPNMGLGFMNGMVDVTVLVNELRRALKASPSDSLTQEQISAVFKKYEEVRRPEVEKDQKISMQNTRLNAWYKPMTKVFDRYIMPKVPHFLLKSLVKKSLGPMINGGRTLDFVDGEELFPNAEMKWVHRVDGHVKKEG